MQRTTWSKRWVMVAVTAGVLLAACSGGSSVERTDEGSAGVAGEVARSSHADLTVRQGLEVIDYDVLIVESIDDIQAYWAREVPVQWAMAYRPLADTDLFPYGPDSLPPPCSGYELTWEEIADNAFWCIEDGYVAWDDVGLFPELYSDFGPFAVSMVLAHEWGHVVQTQVGVGGPTILIEQQADCFAGAWSADIVERDHPVLQFGMTDLEVALGGLLRFRDELGTTSDDPHAHGAGFDRINAFQEGYEYGAARCATYPDQAPVVVDLEFLDEDDFLSGGDLPYEEAVDLAALDLNDFWSELHSDWEPVEQYLEFDLATESPPVCEGTRLERDEAAFSIRFCSAENTMVWDEDLLRTVHTNIGDFGVAALLSAKWAEAAQWRAGADRAFVTSRPGVLQQSCFTGAWAGRLTVPESSVHISGLSPGDLDEAIQAFLAFSERPADLDRSRLAGAFERAQAFRIGFFDGPAACDRIVGN